MSADLQLATACLAGDPAAWDTFVARFRASIFSSALAFTRDECSAEEIASVVWADLYGIETNRHGARVSKLAAYSGRGSLEGWLRTLVAQAYVNRYRKERRFVALDCQPAAFERSDEAVPDFANARLEGALDRALGELDSEQRLILSAHYLDDRTFAEIGRMLGVHESSICRQCNKAINFLRKRTKHHLRATGMSMHEAEEKMGGDVSGITLDVRKRLQLAKSSQ